MLGSNFLPRKTVKGRRRAAAEAAGAAARAARAAAEAAARRAERPTATHVNYISSHMPIEIFRTLPGAQGVMDITARGGSSEDGDLERGGEWICHAGVTPVGAPAAFTLASASRRCGADRARVTRDGTHATHAGRDLVLSGKIPCWVGGGEAVAAAKP